MAAGRTLKSLMSRRRKMDEEGEDDEGPVMVEDSQSEGSVLSDAEDDDEADASSLGDPSAASRERGETGQGAPEAATNGTKSRKPRKPRKKAGKKGKDSTEPVQSQQRASFEPMADTDAMMNGLKISDSKEEAVDFETMPPNGTSTASNGHAISPVEKQRREHEEYKKKRDSDPAFIPNRGNFFMHDTRGQPNGQPPPQRGAWQGRGRGRGGANVGGPFSPANQMAQAERAAEQPWKHDLHESINEEPSTQPGPGPPIRYVDPAQDQSESARLFPKPMPPRGGATGQHRKISFDTTTFRGTVIVRVSLPGMRAPINFSEVPVNSYIRLPEHRPPLRRDKPVRVFIPGHTQRYIFPSVDRSFVFIPRQNRPNQQGFHRGQFSRGGMGHGSRRTSMYGGSMYGAPSIYNGSMWGGSAYSGSVAPSRRGSLASVSRENAFSPMSGYGLPQARPVVRLPHGGPQFSTGSTPLGPLSGPHTPVGMPLVPNEATYGRMAIGTPTDKVHQPRPQKAISVAGIESPALLQNAPSEPQPFQNQLPAHMNEQQAYQPPPPQPYFSPRQQYQYPAPQPQAGTPLSGIPEQAIHAPSFQPPQPYGQPPPYYSQYPPGQNYYYPPQAPNGYPQMPMYPSHGYMPQHLPPISAPQAPQEQEQATGGSEHRHQQSQSGMVAHESNGMVFYVPASEAQQSEQYQPAESFVPSYAMPGLPPPTPAPENQRAYYYPPQMPHAGMQSMGDAVYYPAQQ